MESNIHSPSTQNKCAEQREKVTKQSCIKFHLLAVMELSIISHDILYQIKFAEVDAISFACICFQTKDGQKWWTDQHPTIHATKMAKNTIA